jgi:glyoxylase-like metal-dependent hydrolase (beta-lactamase superfamily II)
MKLPDAPEGRSAQVDVLLAGSLTATGGGVVSSCSLVRDGDRMIVVDPGMAARRDDILDPLRRLGMTPEQVTDVVLSHHHPDHTINVALFPNAAVHDHWAIYRGADWEDSDAEGRELTSSIRLIRVPGHSAEDIALVAGTSEGIIVFTHLWWTDDFPVDDPYSPDLSALRSSRARVLALADVIVPGHGAAFKPGAATPR